MIVLSCCHTISLDVCYAVSFKYSLTFKNPPISLDVFRPRLTSKSFCAVNWHSVKDIVIKILAPVYCVNSMS